MHVDPSSRNPTNVAFSNRNRREDCKCQTADCIVIPIEPDIHEQMCHLSNRGLGGFVHLNYLMLGKNGDEGLSANSGARGGSYFHAGLMGSGAAAGKEAGGQRGVCWAQAEL